MKREKGRINYNPKNNLAFNVVCSATFARTRQNHLKNLRINSILDNAFHIILELFVGEVYADVYVVNLHEIYLIIFKNRIL